MVGHGGRGGNVVSDDDDGVELISISDFLDEFGGLFEHEKVETTERFVHQRLLDNLDSPTVHQPNPRARIRNQSWGTRARPLF